MRTIDEILNKIKQLKGIKKNVDLANLLGVKPNSISTWKSRKKVPYDVLFRFCEENEIDLGWLVTGRLTTKYIDVGGERVLVFSDSPGLYKAKEPVKVSNGNEIPEQKSLGGPDDHVKQEKRLAANAPKREFIGHVIKILDSGNHKAITALESNVEAFLEMVETKEPKLGGGD